MTRKIDLTDNMLSRWNHLRERANVPTITRKEALELMKMWKDHEVEAHLDRLGNR